MRRLLFAVPLVLAACAPSEPSSSAPRPSSMPPIVEQMGTEYYYRLNREGGAITTEFDAPVERVWSVLPAAYAAADVELGTFDTATRTIGNRALTATRRLGKTPLTEFLNCAQGGSGIMNSTSYRVQMSVLSTLAATPSGGTRMETSISATGIPTEGASRTTIGCPSTGRLEQRLAEAVRTALAG